MKYETLGGKTIDTEDSKTYLRYLRIGDRFKLKSGSDIWEFLDEKCNWNGQAGSPTRKCRNLTNGGICHKLCRTQITKIK